MSEFDNNDVKAKIHANMDKSKLDFADNYDENDNNNDTDNFVNEMFSDSMYNHWAIDNPYKFGFYFKFAIDSNIIESKLQPMCEQNNKNDNNCEIMFQIRVKCDNQWFINENIFFKSQSHSKYETFPNDIPPQSHIVNARTNLEWKQNNHKYFIKPQI